MDPENYNLNKTISSRLCRCRAIFQQTFTETIIAKENGGKAFRVFFVFVNSGEFVGQQVELIAAFLEKIKVCLF
jgi:hypothetical protein